MTDDDIVPRNIAQFDAVHPNRLLINKLAKNYESIRARSDHVSQHDNKEIEALNKEFNEHQNKISQLNEEMCTNIFTSNNIKVVFNQSETSGNNVELNMRTHRPEVQIFLNTQFNIKVKTWSIIAQVSYLFFIYEIMNLIRLRRNFMMKKLVIKKVFCFFIYTFLFYYTF